jgi:hypothetical protein
MIHSLHLLLVVIFINRTMYRAADPRSGRLGRLVIGGVGILAPVFVKIQGSWLKS